MKVVILDDFQHVALRLADWSAVARLCPFDVVCVMRERTRCRERSCSSYRGSS
jgi:hypothetical protein